MHSTENGRKRHRKLWKIHYRCGVHIMIDYEVMKTSLRTVTKFLKCQMPKIGIILPSVCSSCGNDVFWIGAGSVALLPFPIRQTPNYDFFSSFCLSIPGEEAVDSLILYLLRPTENKSLPVLSFELVPDVKGLVEMDSLVELVGPEPHWAWPQSSWSFCKAYCRHQ